MGYHESVPAPPAPDVTLLLRRSREGDEAAHHELMTAVYDALRGLAGKLINAERPGHTLQATALVHEAWFKLVRRGDDSAIAVGRDRAHFLAIAARAMRQVLVNHARDRARLKRQGPDAERRVTLAAVAAPDGLPEVEVLALHESLQVLHALDERQALITELRVFGGLSVPETAEVLGVSERTVVLDWSMARRWLAGHLQTDDQG